MKNCMYINRKKELLIDKERHFILSSSKELTSWVKLQVEIFCKASRSLPYKRFLLAA
jgi:hypothetical protein